ncbi:MAG: protein jag [Oscillospiraceae bacterium]|nr:protein jag [Oscillospiraceae bacterium]
MREIIETGATTEEAIEKACAALGLTRDDVSVEILEMPVPKKFFRAAKPAKVKVTVDGEEPVVQPVKTEKSTVKKQENTIKASSQPKEEKQPVVQEAATGEKAALAVEFLQQVSADMGLSGVTVTAVKQGETTILKVDGENVGALIGRRGETMEALSYLTGLVANRSGGDYEKIGLDVAGYRSKRETDLVALAKRIGAKVAKTGRSYTLEPMNPYERRIIHSAISEMEGVKSESTGEGADRRIVISSTDPNAKNYERRPSNNRGRSNTNGRYNNNRSGGNRGPKREYNTERSHSNNVPRPRTQSAAPVAPARTSVKDDAAEIGLYGKIEL